MAHIRKRGKTYWIYYYINGNRVQRSLRTKDINVANYRKNQIEQQVFVGDVDIVHLDAIKNAIRGNEWILSRWNELSFREKQAIIFTLFKGACFHCGKKVKLSKVDNKQNRKRINHDRMVLDHIIPFSCGGSDLPDNLLASCNSCNSKRGTKTIKKFMLL